MPSHHATVLPFTIALAGLAFVACADAPAAPHTSPALDASADATTIAPTPTPSEDRLGRDDAGAVYTLTNATDDNGVIAYRRAANGALTRIGTFSTGGRGTGGTVDPLVSQYAVILNAEHDALFAVDAGSNEVSSFRVSRNGTLNHVSTVSSGGTRPNSLAVYGNLVYALNTGDNTVSGFLATGGARLIPLTHTTHALAAGAAAIRFTHDGRSLVVTERVSNRLEVFPVAPNGRLGDPVVTPAHAGASFGFAVTPHDQPIVSETQGSLTSYGFSIGRLLTPITASISTGGTAACWVTITANGRFAYTTNAGSNFVSGFAVDAAGRLTALTPGVATGNVGAGATPIDLEHVGSRFLYILEAARGTIGTFAINADGTLTARPDTPAGAPSSGLQGIAAF